MVTSTSAGTASLARAMLADGLVDELHLFVYPLTRGVGPRLFPRTRRPLNLSLIASNASTTARSTWLIARRPDGRGRGEVGERQRQHRAERLGV